MASVKVAVRVRPFNKREVAMNEKLIVQMSGKRTRIFSTKVSTISPAARVTSIRPCRNVRGGGTSAFLIIQHHATFLSNRIIV
ncbi:kinesin-like protein Klp98A [Temnothorax curvispinosus]|uniref:Kinesin-like protein Klp98A n=1 Tax=Temnothorax curvispinosus TaxID=300111 RepID=A0A6J1QWD6_9HYME|nr:kinesin-like protein Klp98A [Temnothorax curvispinosus]